MQLYVCSSTVHELSSYVRWYTLYLSLFITHIAWNTVISTAVEILCKRSVAAEFRANYPKLCGNCVFPQNFYTMDFWCFTQQRVNRVNWTYKYSWFCKLYKPAPLPHWIYEIRQEYTRLSVANKKINFFAIDNFSPICFVY